jgi:nicotinate dehydrogenase subunit A
MPHTIAFTLNGREVSVAVAHEDVPLLDVLRNQLGLTGTRFGCGLEQCGCCFVLIDGQPVKSCGRGIASVAGRNVTTIEGLGTPERPRARRGNGELGRSRTRCGSNQSRPI